MQAALSLCWISQHIQRVCNFTLRARDAAARPRYYRDKRSLRYFPASRSVPVVSLPADFVKFSHRPYVMSIRKSFCPQRPIVALKANEVLKEDLIFRSRISLCIHMFSQCAAICWILRDFPNLSLCLRGVAIKISQRSRYTSPNV